jgi:hypothetical protein
VRLKIEQEIAAWEWARMHALEWTPVMRNVRRMTFNTYLKEARSFGIRM